MTASIISFAKPQSKRAASKKVGLTEQRVADLSSIGSTAYFNDSRMPGLSVRVTKAGVKSYVFTRKVNGKFLRVTLGKASGMTLEGARKAVSILHGDIAKGVDVAAVRKAAKTAAMVKAVTLT